VYWRAPPQPGLLVGDLNYVISRPLRSVVERGKTAVAVVRPVPERWLVEWAGPRRGLRPLCFEASRGQATERRPVCFEASRGQATERRQLGRCYPTFRGPRVETARCSRALVAVKVLTNQRWLRGVNMTTALSPSVSSQCRTAQQPLTPPPEWRTPRPRHEAPATPLCLSDLVERWVVRLEEAASSQPTPRIVGGIVQLADGPRTAALEGSAQLLKDAAG
jgi:hypothetical protein